jgi:DNA-binding NtrC family response regulator
MPYKIFIVDDEEIIRVSTADELRDAGYEVKEFENPADVLDAIQKEPADVIITDIKMPQMDGLELLRRVRLNNPQMVVLVMTAYGSVASAVEAMKLGAYDYITKPFDADEIILKLEKIKEWDKIKTENAQLREQIHSGHDFSSIIGESEAVQKVFQQIKTVLNTNTTVLITGETGSGKEMIANAIHHNSNRKDKPFIKVSCAILSREIFESELFGHERGAFTGAIKDKQGKFELADSGTIYLDDIDDIPLDLQVKLLRVLEEREIEKVGGSHTTKIDVRVIASTKADLKQLVEAGKFREDLFYRLNVFPLNLKPLRERKEDIPDLFRFFVKKFSQVKPMSVDPEVIEILSEQEWRGNVRELKNVTERIVLQCLDEKIGVEHLPCEMINPSSVKTLRHLGTKPLDEMLAEIEEETIKRAMLIAHGNKTKAAELLAIPASTLRTKIEKYKIEFD